MGGFILLAEFSDRAGEALGIASAGVVVDDGSGGIGKNDKRNTYQRELLFSLPVEVEVLPVVSALFEESAGVVGFVVLVDADDLEVGGCGWPNKKD